MTEHANGPDLEVDASRGTVVIAKDRCKGCELCIPACPPAVLSMSVGQNAIGFAYPELQRGCTGCGACLMVCPDFCFEVYRFEPAERDGSSGGPT